MIGSIIENYKIIDVLGEGGMGIVYKALDVDLERFVAIKFLKMEGGLTAQFIERFKREARNQAKLNHPNITSVYGFIAQKDMLGIVMELVEGETLEQLIAREGSLTIPDALRYMVQALQGVGYAHSKGFIHRDIKPSNMIINEEGVLKIMDFGISKSVFEKGITKTGTKIGTILYMSPEQINAQEPTQASDVYSLGITLYEMLVGVTPFEYGTEYEIMEGHLKKSASRVSQSFAYAPPKLDKMVQKSLEKDPMARYSSCDEFIVAINDLLTEYDENSSTFKSAGKAAEVWAKVRFGFILTFAAAFIIFFSYYTFDYVQDIWPSIKNVTTKSAMDTTSSFKTNPNYTAGANWVQHQTYSQQNINSVYFLNDSTGFAVGNAGTAFSTVDGGMLWSFVMLDTASNFQSIRFNNSGTGIVAGSKGIIYRTINWGLTWERVESGTSETLFSVKFLSEQLAIITGNAGTILRSENAGTSWQRVSSGTSELLYAVARRTPTELVAVGKGGTIVVSNDNGISFTAKDKISDSYLRDIEFIDEEKGFITSGGGILYITENGGGKWRKRDLSTQAGLASVEFLNHSTGYITTNKGDIYITENSGEEWRPQAVGKFSPITDFTVSPKGKVYISGYSGLVASSKR